jgi:hypothetical protein
LDKKKVVAKDMFLNKNGRKGSRCLEKRRKGLQEDVRRIGLKASPNLTPPYTILLFIV